MYNRPNFISVDPSTVWVRNELSKVYSSSIWTDPEIGNLEISFSEVFSQEKEKQWISVVIKGNEFFFGLQKNIGNHANWELPASNDDEWQQILLMSVYQKYACSFFPEICSIKDGIIILENPKLKSFNVITKLKLKFEDSSLDALVAVEGSIKQKAAFLFKQFSKPLYRDDTKIPITFFLPDVFLPLEQIINLEIGWVLTINNPFDTKILCHIGNTWEIDLALKENTATVLSNIRHSQIGEKRELDENNYFLTEKDVEAIPVKVTFSLKGIDLPVSDICRIGEGYVFELNLTPSEEIIIRLGNRILGYGEIVSIGQYYGVRLTRTF